MLYGSISNLMIMVEVHAFTLYPPMVESNDSSALYCMQGPLIRQTSYKGEIPHGFNMLHSHRVTMCT